MRRKGSIKRIRCRLRPSDKKEHVLTQILQKYNNNKKRKQNIGMQRSEKIEYRSHMLYMFDYVYM